LADRGTGQPLRRWRPSLVRLALTDKVAPCEATSSEPAQPRVSLSVRRKYNRGIIQSFVAMSDWSLIAQNIPVDLAVDVREQVKKIKAPTLSITGKYDQIVPPFYSQQLAEIPLLRGQNSLQDTCLFSKDESI